MCGLFGWQWAKDKQPNKRDRAEIALALAKGADDRGGQSWGVWSPDLVLRGMGKAQAHVGRYAGLPSLFGHSRWATHGTNTIENAHPFIKNGLALSHNGVLSNHYALNSTFNRTHVVDSQHILSHMVENKPFTDIQGYGAICWASEQEKDSIYMGRLSDNGSLYVALTDHGLIWSSVEGPAKDAMKAGHLKLLKSYLIEPGKVYSAEGGTLYVDENKPSILVSKPVVDESWRTQPRWDSGGRYEGGYDFTVGWCNKDKKRYAHCKCQNNPPWVVQIKSSEAAKLKEGDTVEPAKTEPTPTAPVILPALTRTPGTLNWCSRAGCTNHGISDSAMCAEHAAITAARSQTPLQLTESMELSNLPGYWCQAKKCYNLQEKNSDFCGKHRHLMPTPKMESQLSAPQYPWADDMRAAWLDVNGDAPTEDVQQIMKADLAEWWFETVHGMSGAAFVGMSSKEILETAVEMGFDADAALAEAMKPTTEKAHNDPQAEVASVHSSEVKHEPSHGGTSGAVARSTSH